MTNIRASEVGLLANELRRAESSMVPVDLLTNRYPDLTWQDARSIALATDQIRLRDGDTPIGYKLGWTSAAMREALGIERPNWGTLWRSQVANELDLSQLIHPKIEPELVFRSAVDLTGSPSADDISETRGSWALGLEVVDPRFPDYGFGWLDNTADNSSAARVVVGDFAVVDDPASIVVEFTDGSEVRHGSGANAMGDPNAAIAWLVTSLGEEGAAILAGQLIFTGGLTAPWDVAPLVTYTLRSPVLGGVRTTAR